MNVMLLLILYFFKYSNGIRFVVNYKTQVGSYKPERIVRLDLSNTNSGIASLVTLCCLCQYYWKDLVSLICYLI